MNAAVAPPREPRLPLGKVVCTRGVSEAVSAEAMRGMLMRHECGDWGDVSDCDKANNEEAVSQGWRVMSEYRDSGMRVWVITEADRSVTTLLFPSEY